MYEVVRVDGAEARPETALLFFGHAKGDGFVRLAVRGS